MSEKFLVGVITKDRYCCLDVLTTSLRYSNGYKVLIDSSEFFDASLHVAYDDSYQTLVPEKRSVVFNKNALIRYFLQTDCEYLFIIEDDVKIIDPYIFEEYISVSKEFNIPHMNYVIPNNEGVTYDYNNRIQVSDKLFGCFQFFNRECLDRVGLMNENLCNNCWEHIEHTFRIHREYSYDPIWWHFPDYKYSNDGIQYQQGHLSTIITPQKQKNNDRSVMFDSLHIPDFPQLCTKQLHIL